MAGAAPTAKPAPFLKPLDLVDRGVLLAESALSLVIVVLMLFAAVADSSIKLLQNLPWAARAGIGAGLWLLLVGLKLAGPKSGVAKALGGALRGGEGEVEPEEDTLAQVVLRRLGQEVSRERATRSAVLMFVPVALALGAATEWATRAIQPVASDVLMHGTIWAAFLGASFATRGRRHLAIDALSRLLPDRGRRVLVGISSTLGGFVSLALGTGVYRTLVESAHNADQQVLEMIRNGVTASIERGFEFQFIIPVGFTLIGIRLLLHAFHEFVAAMVGRGPTPAPAQSASLVEGQEPPKELSALERSTRAEVIIAALSLVVLVAVSAGSTVFKPALAMALLAAIVVVAPFVSRRGVAPEETDVESFRGSPGQMAVAALLVAGILGVMRYGLVPRITEIPVGAGVAFFAVMALIGAPLFSFLGGMGLFLFVKLFLMDPNTSRHAHAFANSVEDVLGNHFARMSVLATIPLFTLAGYIMSESRMPQRLVRVSRALLGWLPGGLAVVCVFASAFFTIFSGASGITIVAVGGLLVPALLKDNYPEKFSLGLVTTGGALGITVPPCLPLIVYGIVAGLQEPAPGHERLELQRFLVVGLVPGLVAIGLMVLYCVFIGVIAKVPRSRFDGAEARAALWEAKWELMLPVVLLVGLAKGIFNPSQAAAFTAFYVFVMEVFVYRDLTVTRDLPRIIPESMVLVGAIFVKLCAATVLVGYFVQAQTADKLFEWLTCGPPAQAYLAQHSDSIGTCREAVDSLARANQSAGGLIDSKLSFLIALNFFLLIVGMLMDIFSAIVVVVPLIAGIALHFNINPYHLGIVFLLNLEIGYLMPPMGLNLFIAGFRFNRPVPDLYKMVLPFIGLFVVALMITTYVPALTTFTLPAALREDAPAHAPVVNTPTAPGMGGDGGAPLPAGACDVPGDNETFEQFQARCAEPAAAAVSESCDLPGDNETFEQFQARCNPSPTAADAGAGAPAPQGDASQSDAGVGDASD